MAGRSNTTLKKRQKEMARAEKQREKMAKRLDRSRGLLPEQTDEIAPEDGVDGLAEEPVLATAEPVVPTLSWT
jgi:hypothetical protein